MFCDTAALFQAALAAPYPLGSPLARAHGLPQSMRPEPVVHSRGLLEAERARELIGRVLELEVIRGFAPGVLLHAVSPIPAPPGAAASSPARCYLVVGHACVGRSWVLGAYRSPVLLYPYSPVPSRPAPASLARERFGSIGNFFLGSAAGRSRLNRHTDLRRLLKRDCVIGRSGW